MTTPRIGLLLSLVIAATASRPPQVTFRASVDLVPLHGPDAAPLEPSDLPEQLGVPIPEASQQLGRSLDVRHQERDGPRGERGEVGGSRRPL